MKITIDTNKDGAALLALSRCLNYMKFEKADDPETMELAVNTSLAELHARINDAVVELYNTTSPDGQGEYDSSWLNVESNPKILEVVKSRIQKIPDWPMYDDEKKEEMVKALLVPYKANAGTLAKLVAGPEINV